MKAFVSWSSGKDCMYALYRFVSRAEGEVVCLLNISDTDSDKSRSHGISGSLIKRQAEALPYPLWQYPTTRYDYEASLKEAISRLKEQGVEAGIFGDIYLDEHRSWIERVCGEMDIKAIFPLWGEDTSKLIYEFVADGFRSITVAVSKRHLPKEYVGRVIDNNFIAELADNYPDMDLCAEHGEYHSYVFDAPIFSHQVAFEKGEITEDDKHYFIELK